jgi:hypothetical protein
MKKIFLAVIITPLLALSACLMIIDVTINQSINMDIPATLIAIPVSLATNFYGETLKVNEGREAIGQLIDVEELRIAFVLTNKSPEAVIISIAISTNNAGEETNTTVVYFDRNNLHDANQTAFIVDNVSLPPYGYISNTYVSGSVNPVVKNAMIYMDKFALIMNISVEGTFGETKSITLGLDQYISLKISKEINDMPNIISLIQ